MVRPRQFNEQVVVDKAMAVFRKQGYKATSLHDLMRAMAISKSSFYDTFGSKYALFLTTLTRFHKTKAIYNFIHPSAEITALASIANVFNVLIDNVSKGEGGCLLGRCAIEFAGRDAEINKHIAKTIARLEQMFAELLKQGQQNAEISTTLNIEITAQQLVASFYGLQVMTNAGLERKELDQIVTQTIAMLR